MSFEAHEKDYKSEAWHNYTIMELGQWAHLLTARARHRTNSAKKAKDLYDAKNYAMMIGKKIDETLRSSLPEVQEEFDRLEREALKASYDTEFNR